MAVNLAAPSALSPVPGIRLAAGSAGIYKGRSRDDVVLIAADPGSTCGAVFTRNAFCAAPVQVARDHLRRGSPRFCLVNAGNANAGTGDRGLDDALRTCRRLAAVADCAVEEVLPFSTGVIGEYLPVDAIDSALPGIFAALSGDNWLPAARAIMTTDTVPKGCSEQVTIDGAPVTVTGIAKGAGMIHPDMATLLAFIATDAPVRPQALQELITAAAARSFNRISVDGDTSTNDACTLIATARAGIPPIETLQSAAAEALLEAVGDVCARLAQAVVRDGEGATKFIAVSVQGGRSGEECHRVANTVATSPLIKTAFYASDPNWGRILAAVGRAGIEDLDLSGVSVFLEDVCIVSGGGRAPDYTEEAGKAVLSRAEVTVTIHLGRGEAGDRVWTCDLSHEYVTINAEYRT